MVAPAEASAIGVPWPVRLQPGDDLRLALQAVVAAQVCAAAFVLAGIGSLRGAQLRLAGAEQPITLSGDVELLSLCGSIAANGSHLHMSVADASGRVLGGHVAPGCIVRTTAEVLLQLLPSWDFKRETDARTGWAELVIRRRG
ncbi:MAG TPA: PPC domain-containing DNA-binding protein [Rubrivivax sp.]|jgi:predicted DNA-binding protein with PD1-like motif|nr:PPC domain-containing DNA-binding protein [Rubrivivax sp.]